MKKITFLCLLSLMLFSYRVEQDKVVWGTPLKLKGEISSLGHTGNDLFMFCEKRGQSSIERFNTTSLETNGSTPLSLAHPNGGTNTLIINAKFLVEDKMVFFASFYDSRLKKNSLFGRIVNSEGMTETEWTEIHHIDSAESHNPGQFLIRLSGDGSRVMVLAYYPDKGAETQNMRLLTLNKKMEAVSEKSFTKLWGKEKTTIKGFDTDKQGWAFFHVHTNPDGKEFTIPRRNEMNASTKKQLIILNPETNDPQWYDINIGEGLLAYSSTMLLHTNGKVIITGLYQDLAKTSDEITGVFFITINKQNGTVESKTITEFDKALISGLKAGVDLRDIRFLLFDQYQMRHVIERPDGSIVLISEKNFSVSTIGVYGPIIYTGISPAGQILWTGFIPKSTSGPFDCSSFSVFLKNEKIHLLFNDEKRNYDAKGNRLATVDPSALSKTFLTDAVIGMDGKVSYKILSDNSVEKVYPEPRYAVRINHETLMIQSRFAGKLRQGKVTLPE